MQKREPRSTPPHKKGSQRTPTPPAIGQKKKRKSAPNKKALFPEASSASNASWLDVTQQTTKNAWTAVYVRAVPLTEREQKDERERRRGLVYLPITSMQKFGLVLGDPVLLISADTAKKSQELLHSDHHYAVGIAWMGAGLKDDEIRIDSLTAQNCNTRYGDYVILNRIYSGTPFESDLKLISNRKEEARMNEELPSDWASPEIIILDAIEVVVQFLSDTQQDPLTTSDPDSSISEHSNVIKMWLSQLLGRRFIICGNVFSMSLYGKERVLRIHSIKTAPSSNDRTASGVVVGRVTSTTTFTNANGKGPQTDLKKDSITGKISYGSVGGLKNEIDQVREVVELALQSPETFTNFDSIGLKPPKGVLLYGPPGTGKTLIARAVAHETAAKVYIINGPEVISKFYGESEAKLRAIFKEAATNAPALIFIDELDAIAPKRDDAASDMDNRVVATLLTLMDGMEADQGVVVIAATNRPNSIDPALRRAGRFDNEIEIGIPTQDGREEILQVILKKMQHNLTPENIHVIASKTHGFVGADLAALCREAALVALHRSSGDIFKGSSGNWKEANWDENLDSLAIIFEDMVKALGEIHPSAMREVFVEVPKVLWCDIGGQEDIKQKLKEAIEWPLQHPEAFERMGIRPPRGILLYGPPGCSKTLMAKALATESGTNFIAVKGPELFSKWVGESEKAVKEVFRKARAAAPSIIFFDEIDAMAVHRGGEEGGSSGVTDRVLSQLLTEMSGIETLKNVTIVAATNRPDMIDKALLRPGRIDRMLYVAPPDAPSREAIFRIQLKRIPHPEEVEAALSDLVKETDGYSGAELAGVCREACLNALREDLGSKEVALRHFRAAIKTIPPRITQEMHEFYARFQATSGIESI